MPLAQAIHFELIHLVIVIFVNYESSSNVVQELPYEGLPLCTARSSHRNHIDFNDSTSNQSVNVAQR